VVSLACSAQDDRRGIAGGVQPVAVLESVLSPGGPHSKPARFRGDDRPRGEVRAMCLDHPQGDLGLLQRGQAN
jgi:hypothetical protein